jgi:hypothetical protein
MYKGYLEKDVIRRPEGGNVINIRLDTSPCPKGMVELCRTSQGSLFISYAMVRPGLHQILYTMGPMQKRFVDSLPNAVAFARDMRQTAKRRV